MTPGGGLIDPTVAALKASLEGHQRNAPEYSYRAERMRKVVSFFEAITPLYKKLRRLPNHPIQNPYKATVITRKEVG